jgi:hypothetical protein
LNLALESSQSIFDGFAILKSDFSQSIHPPPVEIDARLSHTSRGYGDLSIVLFEVREKVLSG